MDTKKIYCSKEQKETLVELLTNDPELISGKFTKTFTFKDARNRWSAIADTLNALPGCSKDWSQWKRTWQDSRTKVRSKKVTINKHLQGTGGGPKVVETLTSLDEKILELVSPVTIDGDANVPTPTADFQFENITRAEEVDIENLFVEFNDNSSHDVNMPVRMKPIENAFSLQDEGPATLKKKNENKNVKLSTAAKRLTNSLVIGQDMCDIGQQKLQIKQAYYEKKLLLLERQTIALESIAAAKKNKYL